MNINIKKLEALVMPYYSKKDEMHDISHVHRMVKAVSKLSVIYKRRIRLDYIIIGAYFHGVISMKNGNLLNKYLAGLKAPKGVIAEIREVALSSQRGARPKSLEGKILHDAHILEGEPSFYYQKCVITGLERGQSIKDTIAIIKNKVLGKNKCYLPETKKELKKRETIAKKLLKELEDTIK